MFALNILKDRKPVPVDELEWAQWFGAHQDEPVVGRWDFADTEVSTVFLGVDHQEMSSVIAVHCHSTEALPRSATAIPKALRVSTMNRCPSSRIIVSSSFRATSLW